MPLGWECRRDLLKQVTPTPTIKKGTISAELPAPGPQSIALPSFIGGSGYSHIRRAPAYTFGCNIPAETRKPAASPAAALVSVRGVRAKDGKYKITHGVMSPPAYELVVVPQPGPGYYRPQSPLTRPRAARYSLRPPAAGPYSSPDYWSPGANMYYPSCQGTAPAHSMAARFKGFPRLDVSGPGPGTYNHNYKYVKRTEPSFSHGLHLPQADLKKHVPAPNVHCDKKFKSVLRWPPAISFGIKHSPYASPAITYLLPEELVQCDST